MKKNKGFTLIELMITVVIIGVLAAIAYPSYTDYVAKGARAEALAALSNGANLQEQYYFDHRDYASDMGDLGFNANPYITDNSYYSVSSTVSNSSFTLTATAQGVQASRDLACLTISISSSGAKTPIECWQ